MSKQSDWDQRQKDKGKVKVSVWIYAEDRKAVLNYARKKRAAKERTLVASSPAKVSG